MFFRTFFAAPALLLMAACADAQPEAADRTEAATEAVTEAELGALVRAYLLENPEVIEEALVALEDKREVEAAIAARDAIASSSDELFANEADYSIGPDDAEVTVVEFFDYRCGYCKRSVDWVRDLPAEYDGRVRVVFKELPILSTESADAALAALAAGRQGKYVEMHTALMKDRGRFTEADINRVAREVGVDVDRMRADMGREDVKEELNDSLKLATRVGVRATPTFIVGTEVIAGASQPALKKEIETRLEG